MPPSSCMIPLGGGRPPKGVLVFRRKVGGAVRLLVLSSVSLALAGPTGGAAGQAEKLFVYFGTYTGPSSKGIYVSTFDAGTGELSQPELAATTTSPSFLAAHPDGHHLYAVNEIDEFEGQKAGAATSFAIDSATGRLRELNQVSTGGPGPCHLSVHASGRYLFVANYGGGSIAALPIGADGSLRPLSSFVKHEGHGPNAERQEAPHAHEVLMDPSGKLLFAADLGLDKVLGYALNLDKGSLVTPPATTASVAPGSGPRHFAFSADGRFLYVLSEMALSISSFRYEASSGTLMPLATASTLAEGMKPGPGYDAAEVQIHPSGRFLYASNRGPDSIAVFSLDAAKGLGPQIEVVPTGGKTPRGFCIDPTGRYLLAANQGSDTVVVFRIDAATGRLTPGKSVRVGTPVSVTFVRPGR